jgi:hypothetical protein
MRDFGRFCNTIFAEIVCILGTGFWAEWSGPVIKAAGGAPSGGPRQCGVWGGAPGFERCPGLVRPLMLPSGLRSRYSGPARLCSRRLRFLRRRFQTPVTFPVEFNLVGAVAQAVERGGGDHLVGREGRAPFVEVEIGGQHRRRPLVALGDQVMEILVFGRPQRLEAEIVDQKQRNFGQVIEAPFVRSHGLRGAQAAHELRLRDEQHVMALAGRSMPQRLREVALAGAAGAGDDDVRIPVNVTAHSGLS